MIVSMKIKTDEKFSAVKYLQINLHPCPELHVGNFHHPLLGACTNSPVILWFDPKLIATQTILTVSSTKKCAL